MKIKETLKNSHSQQFMIAVIIYAMGFALDKFAQNNFFYNLIGIMLELLAMVYAGFNLLLLYDSGLISSRKACVINLITLSCLILPIIFFSNFITIMMHLTIWLFIVFVVVMLVISLFRMTKLYAEVMNDERKAKETTNDTGEIFDWFDMTFL